MAQQYTPMTDAEKMDLCREILDTVFRLRLTFVKDQGQKTISIGGASFSYASIYDLERIEDAARNELSRLEAKAAGRPFYKILGVLP